MEKFSEEYEFKGITKEDAIRKAEEELGLDKEALIIEVDENGKPKTMFSILDRNRVTIKVKIDKTKEKRNRFNKEYLEIAKKRVTKFLDEISEIYKETNFKYDIEVSGRKILVFIQDDRNAKWIGIKGAILEELQRYLNQIATKNKGNIKVYLNIGNYKEDRERRVKKLASDALIKINETKEPVSLPFMNSYERKLVHSFVEGKGVTTRSVGEEPKRYIIITPEESKA